MNIITPNPKHTNPERILWWDDLGRIQVPFLFVGFEIKNNEFLKIKAPVYVFNVQCGGYACNQKTFQGLIVKPKSIEIEYGMKTLSERYLESCFNAYQLSTLDSYNEYNNDLIDIFETTCNDSFHRLVEAVYPIDIADCRKMTGYKIEEYYNYMFDRDVTDSFADTMTYYHHMREIGLYIMGENCD